MGELIQFGSAAYVILLCLLFFSRGMDFLSTWVATPNLELEANPIAKKMGWKLGVIVNVAVCVGVALWPLPAIMISTTSLLVAARNFQGAWLMRSLGEEEYRRWMNDRIRETCMTTYLFCFGMQTLLVLGVGVAIVYFSALLIPIAIGWGIIAYALAVAFYTLLSVWRARRHFQKVISPTIENVFTE